MALAVHTAGRFLSDWRSGRYGKMYAMLSSASRRRYSLSYFRARYVDIASEATITGVSAHLTATSRIGTVATSLSLPFRVDVHTRLLRDVREANSMPLVAEGSIWRVRWSPSLIFKELSGRDLVRLEQYPAPRGTIYDRNGQPLAIEGEIGEVGIVPGEISSPRRMLSRLSSALHVSEQQIRSLYAGKPSDWFVPIRKLSPEEYERLRARLSDVPGVVFEQVPGRVYPQGSLLGNVLGFVGPLTAEDLKDPQYRDYALADEVGRAGLEHWAEKYLHGRDGARLEVVTPGGSLVAVIEQRDAVPGDDIYLNIDLNLQRAAESVLGGRVGAIVALDPNNGQILALVSHPTYDPNDFVLGMSQEEYQRLLSPGAHEPFVNRATAAAYPLGSTFKPITMAAALTAGVYKPTSRFYDPGYWKELGQVRHEWDPKGFGWLDLNEALTRSADVVFYSLGLRLYQYDPGYLSQYARKWGLGTSPDIDGVVNVAGQVPGPGVPIPAWYPGDDVNLAIGQGALQASPIQDANVYATIANGGTIYRPELINRIVSLAQGGKIVRQYEPEVIGHAPVSRQYLDDIRQDLTNVTQKPYGTGYYRFLGFPIVVAGKTGTGQQEGQLPYAWFSGYAPAGSPRIEVTAFAENAGEGADVSAPMVREVLGAYFHVRPSGHS